MYGILDLTWKPSATQETPPAGKAPAIYRGDTYAHTIRITDGVTNGYDDWTYIAQLRPTRLTGSTADAATASFTITTEPHPTVAADLLVHLSMSAATTLALPAGFNGFWDLQLSLAGVVTTFLAGKAKVLDDVSRAA